MTLEMMGMTKDTIEEMMACDDNLADDGNDGRDDEDDVTRL
jgi:hypothetical protein